MMSLTRSQEIANTLRLAIQNGTYGCGDRLVELTLSQDFDVSQNSIRDALHILQREGWVNKIPRRGVYVPTFTVEEAEEIYALWQAVGRLALGWAMNHWGQTDRKRLRETLILAERKVDAHDWFHAVTAIRNLHTAIALHAEAPRTQTILSRLHNQAHLLENQRLQVVPLTLDEWDTRIEYLFDVLHEIDQDNKNEAITYYSRAIQYEAGLIISYLD